jgi:hypothetical protein
VHEPANAVDQLGRPEHFLDQNRLHPGVQSLAVLGVEATTLAKIPHAAFSFIRWSFLYSGAQPFGFRQ